MMILLYHNFYLRHLISLMEMDVKNLFECLVIPHLKGVGATLVALKAPLRGTLPIAPRVSDALQCLPGGQIDSRKGHRTSDQRNPVDGFAQKERGSN